MGNLIQKYLEYGMYILEKRSLPVLSPPQLHYALSILSFTFVTKFSAERP
jgi:hypothetical protein